MKRNNFVSTVKSLDRTKVITINLEAPEFDRDTVKFLEEVMSGKKETISKKDRERIDEALKSIVAKCPMLYKMFAILEKIIGDGMKLKTQNVLSFCTFIDESELVVESIKLIVSWRIVLRLAYQRGQIHSFAALMMECTLDVWSNIATGGVIYKDDNICAVYYKPQDESKSVEDCDLKIAVATPWNGWSYYKSPTDRVPIASLRGLKAAIARAKLDPKLQGLSGELVSENYRLARFLGMEVVNNRAYLT